MRLASEINDLTYLYLTELEEPEDNVLRLVVTEARIADRDTPLGSIKPLGELSAGARPIVADDRCAAYEITFEDYVAYAVVNESYTVADDTERFEGKLLRVYSESKFLTYVASATIASNDYGGPYTHYGIVCLNHIVEIVSHAPPRIVASRPSATERPSARRFPFRLL